MELIGLETDRADNTYAWEDKSLHGGDPSSTKWTRACRDGAPMGDTLERWRPDVLFVNGWGFADSLEGLAWAARRGTPVCMFSDSRASDSPRRPAVEWTKRRLLALCDAAVVAGPEHADYLQALGMPGDRILDGYDAVDNDYFAQRAAESRLDPMSRRHAGLPDANYFLSVGRFVAKKNLPGLVKSYDLYRSRLVGRQPWSLVLVGDGPERDELQSMAARSPHRGDITLLPFQQYDRLPSIYAQAACFVLASTHSEQWGLVVNEAMACGLPVLVSAQCGCAASLVRDGENGHLLNPYDIAGVADAMLRVCSASADERAQMGRHSERIVAEWSLDRFAQGFLAAAEIAASRPRQKRLIDRALVRLLAQTKSARSPDVAA
jgi:glycosyltransferase involved in cell wall biosynthesis